VAASLKTEDELRQMFRERLVWENPADIALLRSKGLLTRIYGPQVRRHFFLELFYCISPSCGTLVNSMMAGIRVDPSDVFGVFWSLAARISGCSCAPWRAAVSCDVNVFRVCR
jgi:hypothetical protein